MRDEKGIFRISNMFLSKILFPYISKKSENFSIIGIFSEKHNLFTKKNQESPLLQEKFSQAVPSIYLRFHRIISRQSKKTSKNGEMLTNLTFRKP